MKPACAVEGCARPVKAGGYCGAHYQQKRRGRLGQPAQAVELDASERLDVRVPGEWRAEVEAAAKRRGWTVSHWVREAIRAAVLREVADVLAGERGR